MSAIFDSLKSPWVLAGGAALGLVLLLNKNGAPTSSNSAIDPNYLSAVSALNQTALHEVTSQARISADVAIARSNNDATKQVATLSTIRSAGDNLQVIRVAEITSNQGIAQSMIATQGAVTMDILANANRLSLAQEQTVQAIHHDNTSVDIARLQAHAVSKAALFGAIGSTVGALGKAASYAF